MSADVRPPPWAEALLRRVLDRQDADCVSGDLLEEYRDAIRPVKGQRRADWWYITQVAGFVSRDARVWALLFGAAFVARTALDWLAPPRDFHLRANISTTLGIVLLAGAGARGGWRTGSVVTGAIAAIATAAIAAVISLAGAAALLAIFHDPDTLTAIRASGGLSEVFTLPPMMIVPALVLGSLGAVAGVTLKRLFAGRMPQLD
jgi:hypothetical protein